MRRRLMAVLCSALVFQFSAGDVARRCAADVHEKAPTDEAPDHAHHSPATNLPVQDSSDVPGDDCETPTSRACCVPALSCSITLAVAVTPEIALTPESGDRLSPTSASALRVDPASPETPPPRV